MKKTGPRESNHINKASTGMSQLRIQKMITIDTDRSNNRFIY
jgi:hypothetical protein